MLPYAAVHDLAAFLLTLALGELRRATGEAARRPLRYDSNGLSLAADAATAKDAEKPPAEIEQAPTEVSA